MKKLLLLVAVALAFSLTALAQGTTGATGTETQSTTKSTTSKKGKSSKGAATESTSKGAGKQSSITGCLGKSDSGYTLTNGRYKKGVEVTSEKDISAHVGHKVKLTGKWDTPGKAFTATDMKHISETCAAGGKKAAAGAKKGKAGKEGAESKTPKS